ncbi:MAG: hypothetical protein LBH01_02085 [Verrucomicrobiales bacterium]|jgi:hypothetical protein|nr:hypothetical protein [Verrucomicrobiales bacterium]
MNVNPVQSFVAGAALVNARQTKLNAQGRLVYTGAGEAPLGSTVQDYAENFAADIHLHNAGGQHYVTQGDAVNVVPGDRLTTGADGRVVKAAAGAEFFFTATEPSGGQDSIFRAAPTHGQTQPAPAPEA